MDIGITQNGKIAGADFTKPNQSSAQDSLDNGGSLTGLLAKCGLSSSDFAQVEALANAVRRADGVELKLNFPRQVVLELTDPLVSDNVSDLCYYEGGRLVGYAPLDGDGDELEVTAAVLPSHRRRGVVRLLLDAARREAQRRGAKRLLLVSDPDSFSGAAAVNALGLPYITSEYRMEVEADALSPLDTGQMRLVQADESNVTELARLRALSFGGEPGQTVSLLTQLDTAGSRCFLAECGGEYIGQIGVMDVGDGIYIRGFGIIPERRQRGYGRQLLAATMQLMLAEGQKHFALDVATDKLRALSLYETCGFRVMEAYDYHDVPLKRL